MQPNGELAINQMVSAVGFCPAGDPTHPFKPRDRVLVKRLFETKTADPPFGPPFTVIAVTRTTVLAVEHPAWTQGSWIKAAPQEGPMQGTATQRLLSPEDNQERTATNED